MKNRISKVEGFSLAEVIMVTAITVIIVAIVAVSLSGTRSKKQLQVTTDAIDARLEEAKASALSGKNGSNYGVQFSSTTYTYFSGSSYNPNDASNNTVTIPSNLSIYTQITGGGTGIIFSRLTGTPQNYGLINIRSSNNSSTTISIGALGDINVIK